MKFIIMDQINTGWLWCCPEPKQQGAGDADWLAHWCEAWGHIRWDGHLWIHQVGYDPKIVVQFCFVFFSFSFKKSCCSDEMVPWACPQPIPEKTEREVGSAGPKIDSLYSLIKNDDLMRQICNSDLFSQIWKKLIWSSNRQYTKNF